MTKLTDIEGIGQIYAARLSKAGIRSPAKLIQNTATPQRLSKLANSTGIAKRQLLTWSVRAKRIRTGTKRRKARRTASANEPSGTGGGRPGGSI
jgi:hypothetical protein